MSTAKTVSVTSPAGQQITITFPDARFQDPHTWKVVAFRVDPCAPGCSHDVVNRFGSSPQVRLILQPVTVDGQVVTVHDFTTHLVFSFTTNIAPPFKPDDTKFRLLVSDLLALKQKLAKAGINTSGPLTVHPGLTDTRSAADFAMSLKTFLSAWLSDQNLFAASFMGLAPRPEPWLFFALVRGQGNSLSLTQNASLGGQAAQMLTFRSGNGGVVMPAPTPSNVPPKNGVSTSLLFSDNTGTRLDTPALADDASSMLLRDVPDFIANPQRTNFFNTDCVSCHSESTRRQTFNITTQTTGGRFAPAMGVSGVNPDVLPKDPWNVRNLGWFPGFPFGQPVVPTATQRTANESAEAADAINRIYLTVNTLPNRESQEPTMPHPIASPLTLVMKPKSQQDLEALTNLIKQIQSMPPDQNPITRALTQIGTVHFARFVLIEGNIAVITTYDGVFDRYIDAFVDALGGVFDQLLVHIADAPATPVSQHRKEFLEYVHKHDLATIGTLYSAYPDLSVQDILALKNHAAQKK